MTDADQKKESWSNLADGFLFDRYRRLANPLEDNPHRLRSGYGDRCDCKRSDPLLATDESHELVSGRLDADISWSQIRGAANALLHCCSVRKDLRRLCYQGRINRNKFA